MDLSASARTQISWLSEGRTSSEALLDAYRQQYEKINPALKAVVATDFGAARALAQDYDQRRAKGENLGPLGGLPMTVKDSYDVDGMPAVCGDPSLSSRPAKTADAEIVRRLKDAGAIIWGKTNTPLHAGDIQTYNDVYGVTNNPHDQTRTPGGSSGGAAAALAAHLTPLEIGSDIGGSLRTPAHNCGICALKPTYGLIPLLGHVPPPPGVEAPDPDLAVAGPMARNVEDLSLLLSIVAPNAKAYDGSNELADLRVGVWEEPSFTLSNEVAATLNALAELASQHGASVERESPEIDGKHLVDVYQRLLMPIVTASLPPVVKASFKAGRIAAKLTARKGEMTLANTMISATQSPKELAQTQSDRANIKEACASFFKNFDILIAPVTSVPAIPHNNKKEFYSRRIDVDGEPRRYTTLFEWISLATACHLPSATIRCGTSKEGLPIGLQIIGAEGQDTRVVAVAQKLEALLRSASQVGRLPSPMK